MAHRCRKNRWQNDAYSIKRSSPRRSRRPRWVGAPDGCPACLYKRRLSDRLPRSIQFVENRIWSKVHLTTWLNRAGTMRILLLLLCRNIITVTWVQCAEYREELFNNYWTAGNHCETAAFQLKLCGYRPIGGPPIRKCIGLIVIWVDQQSFWRTKRCTVTLRFLLDDFVSYWPIFAGYHPCSSPGWRRGLEPRSSPLPTHTHTHTHTHLNTSMSVGQVWRKDAGTRKSTTSRASPWTRTSCRKAAPCWPIISARWTRWTCSASVNTAARSATPAPSTTWWRRCVSITPDTHVVKRSSKIFLQKSTTPKK